MTHVDPVTTLSDAALFEKVQRLAARSNVTLADLLVHLGEVEARGLHRTRACASLYTYCIYELRMSEDAAYRRSKAARLVREHPELRDAIARGEIHLTGVLMIGPHLGGERRAEILESARFRSKRELARLVAEIDPRPEVPSLVEPLGPALFSRAPTHEEHLWALAGPVRHLPPGQHPGDWIEDAANDANDANDAGPSRTTASAREQPVASAPEAPGVVPPPARPLHYKVQFTASQELVDLLKEVSDLLGHERPRPSLPEIHLRALRALARELRASKRAATARPRRAVSRNAEEPGQGEACAAPARGLRNAAEAGRGKAGRRKTGRSAASGAAPARVTPETQAAAGPFPEGVSRYVPAAVRREVWERDGARCAYVDDRGERCRETAGLEMHHRHAFALGGLPTAPNLELACPAHNALAAEQDFGREHMDWMRGRTDGAAPARGGA